MRKLVVVAGAAALGLGLQTAAFAYSATANVTFTIGGSSNGNSADQGYVSNAGPIPVGGSVTPSNATRFHSLTDANSTSSYSPDFAAASDCVIGGPNVPASAATSATRKYGCRYSSTGGTFFWVPVPGVTVGQEMPNSGPVAQATGTINVTNTTMTGTLTIVNTADVPTGATTVINTTFTPNVRLSNSVGNGFAGYNYRTADGSPFGAAWYGITTAGTYTLNLTGTFNATSWTITGGTATFIDPGYACQQGGVGGDAAVGTLCTPSTIGGGFNPNGSHLSWGMDPDGTGTATMGPIPLQDQLGNPIDTLSGAVAQMTISPTGVISTTSETGEFRKAFGNSSGCATFLQYNTSTHQLTCGSITSSRIVITGQLADTDVDGAPDATDNCRLVANNTGAGAQCDTDGDGFGNRCDGDFGNPAPGNGATNAQDYAIFRPHLGISTSPTGPFDVADLNCNGTVNAQDYAIFRPLLGTPPGPGAPP